jgi:hypothetical protein
VDLRSASASSGVRHRRTEVGAFGFMTGWEFRFGRNF